MMGGFELDAFRGASGNLRLYGKGVGMSSVHGISVASTRIR